MRLQCTLILIFKITSMWTHADEKPNILLIVADDWVRTFTFLKTIKIIFVIKYEIRCKVLTTPNYLGRIIIIR